MKIYNIEIQPDAKLRRKQISRLASEINLKFRVKVLAYDDVFAFDKEESLRLRIENIIEDTVPDLLMYFDNIAWGGYKVIDIIEIGGSF